MSMYELGVYLGLTVVLGGGAGIMMGRNFATNWRSPQVVALAAFGIAAGVRFLHYALFEQTLLTASGFLLDAVAIIVLALLGYRWRRTEQMTSQYYWLYERTGPLAWRSKTPDAAPDGGAQ